MSPRLARRPSPARRLPRGRPSAPPPGPGSSSSPYNAAGGLRRPARYPTRAAAGPRRLRLPGSAPAPGPCQGLQPCAAGRGPDPESGGGRGAEGARAGGRGAPWPRQKMAAWHDPGPAPRPAPPPGLEAPRGGGTLQAPGRAEGRPGPAPGSAASRSSRGHLWLGGAGRRRAWEGRALGERARSGGARSRGGQAERRGGGALSPAPPCPRCGPWERGGGGGGGGGAAVWGRGGSGRGSPGPAAEGWKVRGRERRGWKRLRWGCRGRPLQQTPPAHTHTHPRRAAVDVSLKASHLHSEGRSLAEAADRGSRSPRCPHIRRPRASERRRPRSVSRPHPGSPLQAVKPSLLVGADRAGKCPGPAPGLPQPLFAGPAALWLPNFILLSWSLPSWGHPLPSLPPQLLPPFLHPLLSSPAKPAE